MTMQPKMGSSGLPPQIVCSYIEDMLMELAAMARQIEEPGLAPHIEAAAALAHQANLRRNRAGTGDAA